jgi:argininosuccinate lyase
MRSTRWRFRSSAMTGMVRDAQPDAASYEAAAGMGYATATDLADWLVRTLKMPFREAHHVTGRIVAKAARADSPLHKLSLCRDEEGRGRGSRRRCSACCRSIARWRAAPAGGTAPNNVRAQAKKWLKKLAGERS